MDKTALLEITFNKLAGDKNFMAWYLAQSAAMNNCATTAVMGRLHCDAAAYYKLALCKVPDAQRSDYSERLASIAGYANVSLPALNELVREVNAAQQPTLAALLWLQQVYAHWQNSWPAWLKSPSPLVFKTGFSAFSLLFFVMLLTAKVDERSIDFYNKRSLYADSVKHLCLQDNTYIAYNAQL